MSSFVFILIAVLTDSILNFFFGLDPSAMRLSFISQASLIALMFIIRQQNTRGMLISSFLLGFFYDLSQFAPMFILSLTTVLTMLLMQYWAKHVNDTVLEWLVLGLLLIFIHNFISFAIARIFAMTRMQFMTWLGSRMFLTLLLNIPLIVMLYYLNKRRLAYEDHQDHHRRIKENSLWIKLVRPKD